MIQGFKEKPSIWNWNYIFRENEKPIAKLHVPWYRTKSHLLIKDKSYKLYRKGIFWGNYVMVCDGKIIGYAKKGWAHGNFKITYQNQKYQFNSYHSEKLGLLIGSSPFTLYREKEPVGKVKAIKARMISIDLPVELELSAKVFIVWLAVIIWKRDMLGRG